MFEDAVGKAWDGPVRKAGAANNVRPALEPKRARSARVVLVAYWAVKALGITKVLLESRGKW